jgi:cytochrome b561
VTAEVWRNTLHRYGVATLAFHWIMAVLILFMFVLGPYMKSLPETDPSQFFLFQLHKSVGLTILSLAVLRIAWRFATPSPEFPASMEAWERLTARRVHFLLYLLMIAVPAMGWAAVSASPLSVPTMWFGLFEWPHLSFLSDLPRAEKRDIEPVLAGGHGVLAFSMISLSAIHTAAALKHHFWDRDDVLKRMLRWPTFKP